MHVIISTAKLDKAVSPISGTAADAVRMNFSPPNAPFVDRLKALAAAFISECERVAEDNPATGREIALAKTNAEQAAMWAVKAATAHLD